MRQHLRYQLWILLAGGIVAFTHLGGTRLWDKDETIYGSCAREMFERGDWVVPTFNGDLFPDKPPLMYWLMMVGYHLFGVTEFAARFWSAVLAVGTALVTYHLGCRLFGAEVGLWAGLIVVSNVAFAVSARAATVDSALTFTATLAVLLFIVGTGATCCRGPMAMPAAGRHTPAASGFAKAWLAFALMYGVLGAAVLAKGPVGVLLPAATFWVYLFLVGIPVGSLTELRSGTGGLRPGVTRALRLQNIVGTVWRLRPVMALVVVLAVAGPWFVLVGLRTDGVWLTRFFLEQNLRRALATFDNHSGPAFYYIPAILVGFFPWSVFLGPTLIHVARRVRGDDPRRPGYILALCWLGVYMVFWSCVRTKLPHYVLPAYPALALLTAAFLQQWLETPAYVSRGWMLNATITWMVVGVALLVAVPAVAAVFLPGEEAIGLVGLILVAGGAWCLIAAQRGQTMWMMAGYAVTSVVFVTAVLGFAARRVDRHQNAPALLAEIRRECPGPIDLAAYRFFRESFVFYAGRTVPHFHGPAALQAFLEEAQRPYVLTTDEYIHELNAAFPHYFTVLARRPRFLKRGELMVLAVRGRRDGPAAPVRPAGHARTAVTNPKQGTW